MYWNWSRHLLFYLNDSLNYHDESGERPVGSIASQRTTRTLFSKSCQKSSATFIQSPFDHKAAWRNLPKQGLTSPGRLRNDLSEHLCVKDLEISPSIGGHLCSKILLTIEDSLAEKSTEYSRLRALRESIAVLILQPAGEKSQNNPVGLLQANGGEEQQKLLKNARNWVLDKRLYENFDERSHQYTITII